MCSMVSMFMTAFAFSHEQVRFKIICLVALTGAPARTVGWRDPGFIHTSFLKDLWPNKM